MLTHDHKDVEFTSKTLGNISKTTQKLVTKIHNVSVLKLKTTWKN